MQIKILQHREKGSKCSILGPADALSIPIQLFSTELTLNYLTALRFFFGLWSLLGTRFCLVRLCAYAIYSDLVLLGFHSNM